MLVTYTHSRAAILCIGGWGLQVMLHLAPRLRASQEQRAALQAQGPDFNRITSFGAVLPEPLLTGDGQAQFYLRRPKPDVEWPPSYVERLLSEIAAQGSLRTRRRHVRDAHRQRTAGYRRCWPRRNRCCSRWAMRTSG